MPKREPCNDSSPKDKKVVVYACSGPSSVGETADHAAREAANMGLCQMGSVAGIAAQIGDMVNAAKDADEIIVVDGCELDCGKLAMENAGFKGFRHIRVTDLGAGKGGRQEVTEVVVQIVQAIKETRELVGQ